jgi:hypothetical protein
VKNVTLEHSRSIPIVVVGSEHRRPQPPDAVDEMVFQVPPQTAHEFFLLTGRTNHESYGFCGCIRSVASKYFLA